MKKVICWSCLLWCFGTSWAAPAVTTQKAKNIASLTTNLRPAVVTIALDVFYNSLQLGIPVKKPIITIIDYSLPSDQPRLWVVDLTGEKILYNSLVAHGINSGRSRTSRFSNHVGSLQTSLGIFLTGKTYMGKHGYSLKLKGLERGINDKAEERSIVLHGAHYVSRKLLATSGKVGRSWGCPAVEANLARPIIDTIKEGTLVFAYYPNRVWLSRSALINNKLNPVFYRR